ncbi:hypothetical protein L207DRAFT_590827 [Hyaloscypha variabilis F]|uniref:Cell wall protein n=1 Tax=Hyaloscypha variabilis (strain UAMH 11265 / GT02V1 / F) TaxID=1149755 RepID=A0A2J6R0C7_HYAVF|nr:hypothetical protein L207DRAFT_590827 [Hyaloscypha variabilis F]
MRLGLLIITLSCFSIAVVYSSPLPISSSSSSDFDFLDSLLKRTTAKATTRTKATTVTQSVNNWIEDINTVNSFLNVALALPPGPALKAGASKALAYAQDEPVNVEFLKATPGINAAGLSAATTLEQVFGDVLNQLGNVVAQPLSLPVAINAVARINVNRCNNVLPAAETMWKSAAVAMNISTATWPPKANREAACLGKN